MHFRMRSLLLYIYIDSLTKNTDATTAWQLWYHKGHIKPPSKYMFKSREKNRGHKGCKGWNWRPIFQIIITIKLTTVVHHSPCLIITSSASCFTKLMTLVYGLNHTNRLTRWKTALRISLGCCRSMWCCGARV